MRPSSVNISYDPVQLSEALMYEFVTSHDEIFRALKTGGLATRDKLVWLMDFSFAFSTSHPQIKFEGVEGLKFNPEFFEEYLKEEKFIDHRDTKEGFDDRKLGRYTLSADQFPKHLEDDARTLSLLGMSVIAIESSRYMLTNGQYNHFISLLLVARELFTSWKLSQEGIQNKKRFAKANALKRHMETYRLRDEVIEYWKANISPTLSNEKAASLLVNQFPLSHRKLKQYIAEAKRGDTSC